MISAVLGIVALLAVIAMAVAFTSVCMDEWMAGRRDRARREMLRVETERNSAIRDIVAARQHAARRMRDIGRDDVIEGSASEERW